MSGAVRRRSGARRDQKPSSAMVARISPATPQLLWPTSTTSARPVFATDSRIVGRSSGTSVRGSITSSEMPSRASVSAAVSASRTREPMATTVRSLPSRRTAACPNGIR